MVPLRSLKSSSFHLGKSDFHDLLTLLIQACLVAAFAAFIHSSLLGPAKVQDKLCGAQCGPSLSSVKKSV